MTKSKKIIIRISISALMIALIYIATMFLAIPYPGSGYFNFSDALILFTTIYVGPIEGIISGITACALADLTGGYVTFIPFTILAKGLESLVAFLIYYVLKKHKYVKYVGLFCGAIVMALVYFISYVVLFDISYATISTPFDILQGVLGAILATILLKIFEKIPLPYNKDKEKNE